MEKTNILNKHVGKTLHALMMLLFLWCGVTTASAEGAGTIDDPFVITADGGTFTAETSKIYGVFTAPSEGELVVNETYSFYTDATFTTRDDSMSPTFNGNYANKEYSCAVEAGKTYYIYVFSWTKSITVKFRTEAEPLELQSVSPDPAENEVFNAGKGTLDLQFNQPVSIEACELKAGSNTENVVVNVRDIYAIVDVKDYLATYYSNGTLKEGDDIIFKFTGVKRSTDGVIYNGDGVVEVAFKSGPKPLMLVSSTGTPDSETPVNTFKSYYMQNDKDGMIMLTYSDNISEVGAVNLSYGTTDGSGDDGAASSFYSEDITPKILDNTVVIDFRGVLRRHADMLPGYETKFPTITLRIAGVKDANGNSAYSPGLGTIGTYNFTYNYKEVEYSNTTDWAEDNTTISNGTKNIELWLNEEGGNATFTGVEFAYTDGGENKTTIVNVNELTIEADPEFATAKIITVPVPNVKMDEGKVKVNLVGVETPDGVEHDYAGEFTCTGKTVANFQITSAMLHTADGDVEMVNGTIGTIASKTVATITTSKEVGYMTWEITEPELGQLKNSYGTPNASTFDITIRGAALKCLSGKTYTFTLKAWNSEAESRTSKDNPTVGTASFTFTGTESDYVYSDVSLLNHIADPFPLTDKEQNTYTLNFSASANVKKAVANLGMGMSEECELVANDDKTEWTLTFPTSVLGYDEFDINVFAEDLEGRAINKNSDNVAQMGSEDNTWLPIHFTCEFNRPDFTVEPASESTLEKIDVITFSYNGGINVSYSGDKIQIWGNRQLVKEIEMSELKRPEGYEGTDKLCIVLDEPITAAGNYNVDIPAGFFVLGEQFESFASKTTTVYYAVGAPAGELTVTPASESTVEKIDKITFTYVGGINTSWNGESITVQKRENPTTYTDVASFTADDVQFDYDDYDNMWIDFAEPITEPGIYVVNIPAGFFVLGENGNAENEAMTVYYEIKAPQEELVVTVNPEGGKVTEIPAIIVLTAEGREGANFMDGTSPVLKDNAGNSYAAHFKWGEGWNEVNVILENGAITANGTYTLTIPAGAVYGNDENDTYSEDIVITYIIGGTDAIDSIVANAGGKVDVYTINGTNILRNADAAAVKSLAKGLYIINGKKVVIK